MILLIQIGIILYLSIYNFFFPEKKRRRFIINSTGITTLTAVGDKKVPSIMPTIQYFVGRRREGRRGKKRGREK